MKNTPERDRDSRSGRDARRGGFGTLLRQFGFYPEPGKLEGEGSSTDSCGAYSPRVASQELATRA
jgi:hypothetical protein